MRKDPADKLTSHKQKNLTWTRGRLLKSYGNVIYEYDYTGTRTYKRHGSYRHTYVMQNGNLLSEEFYNLNELYTNYYFYNQSGLFGAQINGTVYYYVKNLLGDIIEIRRADNNSLAASYEYDAWGNHKVYDSDGSENNDPNFIGNLNPFRYRGYYFDTDVKMYYLQTRWYDPEVGRFINLDQIQYLDPETVNGLNLYAYCQNNPVMGYDPTGTAAWWDWAIAIAAIAVCTVIAVASGGTSLVGMAAAGAAIAGTTSVVTQELTTGDFDLGQVAVDMIAGGASGAVGASGVTRVESAILGAVINTASYGASKYMKGEQPTIAGTVASVGMGAFFGYRSGSGARNPSNFKNIIEDGMHVIPQKIPEVLNNAASSFTKQANGIMRTLLPELYDAITEGTIFSNLLGGL